jgi:STAS domain
VAPPPVTLPHGDRQLPRARQRDLLAPVTSPADTTSFDPERRSLRRARMARQEGTQQMSNDVHEGWRRRGAGCAGAARSAVPAGDEVVDLDVSWLVPADLDAVDALARLQVALIRSGRRLLLHGVNGGLAEILEFVGLSDVVQLCPDCRSSVEWPEPRCAEADAERSRRPRRPGRQEGRTVRTAPGPGRRGWR